LVNWLVGELLLDSFLMLGHNAKRPRYNSAK